MQIFVSIRNREKLVDVDGDPWGGRTLEWATSSPPPSYNFAFSPMIHDGDAWWQMKQRGYERPLEGFKPIHMPNNTEAGVVIAALSVVFGFAMIWYIWWLAVFSFIGIVGYSIYHTFNYDKSFYIPVSEVIATEAERTRLLAVKAKSA